MSSLQPPNTPRPHEVKHTLHRNVFHPNGERLIAFTQVAKTEPSGLSFMKNKENIHYLCCSATTKRPYKVYISRYRRPDKGDGYEERRKWPIEELTKVDGRDVSPSCLELHLHFQQQKIFRFECTQPNHKEEFLEGIAQACKYFPPNLSPPVFENCSNKVKKNLPNASGEIFGKFFNSTGLSVLCLTSMFMFPVPFTKDLRSQMSSNQRELHERGAKVSELESRTQDMADTAKTFSETARDLAAHYRGK